MRDIDDWMFHFERQAGPRLKELFGENLDGLPLELISRLEKLKDTDASPATERVVEKPARE